MGSDSFRADNSSSCSQIKMTELVTPALEKKTSSLSVATMQKAEMPRTARLRFHSRYALQRTMISLRIYWEKEVQSEKANATDGRHTLTTGKY